MEPGKEKIIKKYNNFFLLFQSIFVIMSKLLIVYISIVIALLHFCPAIAQPSNRDCSGAQHICFGLPATGSNAGAGSDEWASSCHSSNNAVWYSFTTNAIGGEVMVVIDANCPGTVDVGSTLLAATSGCDTTAFIEIDCYKGAPGRIVLNASNLDSLTTYYIVLNSETGNSPADCDFKIDIAGPGVEYSADATVEDAVCFEKFGSVTIERIDMGPGPYSYSMQGEPPQSTGSFSNLSTGFRIITIVDGKGCKQEVPFYINGLKNILQVDGGEDKTIIEGSSVQLNATGNGISFFWDPPVGLNEPSMQNPFASPLITQTYRVYTYSPENCQAMDSMTVVVMPKVIIPNVITPNADNMNDSWQLEFIEEYPECIINIYNRWGQRVFLSSGYKKHQEWKGEKEGTDLAPATYFYVVDLNANTDSRPSELYNGTVTIFR